MARGAISTSLKAKSKELLGYEIERDELRLMPYVQYVMMNEQKLDIAKIAPHEREILRKWKDAGYIEGGASGLTMTKEFWDILSELLWISYVAGEED